MKESTIPQISIKSENLKNMIGTRKETEKKIGKIAGISANIGRNKGEAFLPKNRRINRPPINIESQKKSSSPSQDLEKLLKCNKLKRLFTFKKIS